MPSCQLALAGSNPPDTSEKPRVPEFARGGRHVSATSHASAWRRRQVRVRAGFLRRAKFAATFLSMAPGINEGEEPQEEVAGRQRLYKIECPWRVCPPFHVFWGLECHVCPECLGERQCAVPCARTHACSHQPVLPSGPPVVSPARPGEVRGLLETKTFVGNSGRRIWCSAHNARISSFCTGKNAGSAVKPRSANATGPNVPTK